MSDSNRYNSSQNCEVLFDNFPNGDYTATIPTNYVELTRDVITKYTNIGWNLQTENSKPVDPKKPAKDKRTVKRCCGVIVCETEECIRRNVNMAPGCSIKKAKEKATAQVCSACRQPRVYKSCNYVARFVFSADGKTCTLTPGTKTGQNEHNHSMRYVVKKLRADQVEELGKAIKTSAGATTSELFNGMSKRTNDLPDIQSIDPSLYNKGKLKYERHKIQAAEATEVDAPEENGARIPKRVKGPPKFEGSIEDIIRLRSKILELVLSICDTYFALMCRGLSKLYQKL